MVSPASRQARRAKTKSNPMRHTQSTGLVKSESLLSAQEIEAAIVTPETTRRYREKFQLDIAGKEKALRRTGLSPKFLSRSSAHGYDSHWNKTTKASISSGYVNRKLLDYIQIELNPRLGTEGQPSIFPICPYPLLGGVKTYQGRGGVKTYQVGSTPVLLSCSRCSTPPNITKVIRRRDQSLAPTLRLEKLRVPTALAPRRRSAAHLFSKLAVPKENSTSSISSSSSGRSRALVTEASSHFFSRGNGGLL
jgi:hypothetical protein